jgi:hypothetical protein
MIIGKRVREYRKVWPYYTGNIRKYWPYYTGNFRRILPYAGHGSYAPVLLSMRSSFSLATSKLPRRCAVEDTLIILLK